MVPTFGGLANIDPFAICCSSIHIASSTLALLLIKSSKTQFPKTHLLRSVLISSLYRFLISSKFEMMLNVSRSITRHVTPSGESQIMLAVRKSSLWNKPNFKICPKDPPSLFDSYPCSAFSPKKSPFDNVRMNFSSSASSVWRMVTRT
jgi:hypothetical protein